MSEREYGYSNDETHLLNLILGNLKKTYNRLDFLTSFIVKREQEKKVKQQEQLDFFESIMKAIFRAVIEKKIEDKFEHVSEKLSKSLEILDMIEESSEEDDFSIDTLIDKLESLGFIDEGKLLKEIKGLEEQEDSENEYDSQEGWRDR